MCVDNYNTENIYKFEYEDICYRECPLRTQKKPDSTYWCEDCPNFYNFEGSRCIDSIPEGYYLNSSLDKTIDKCPSKCGICSLESNKINLCISCNINENFYPKSNDNLNTESFIECYNQNEEKLGY